VNNFPRKPCCNNLTLVVNLGFIQEAMSSITGKNIAVLKGGPGSERQVSLKTAEGVAEALRSLGAEVVEVDVTGPAFDVPEGVLIAMNMIHGTFGEDGQLQALLEQKGIRYTGAGVKKSRIAFDKNLSKEKFIAAGVPTPRSQIFRLDVGDTLKLDLPVVVKPPREGSSVGVHICRTAEEFAKAIEDAKKFGSETLIEESIEGKELTIGILGDQVLPVIYILPVEGFYDMNNKYPWLNGSGKSEYECPAQLDDATTKRVQEAALAAFMAVGVEVYGRVDIMLRASDQQPFVLEINTIPGMTATSLLPKAAAAAGIAYPQLCERIIELSLAARG
jgi:D-alanine-D-alanine ligase